MTSGFVHRAHTLIRALAPIMLAALLLVGCEAPVTTTGPTPAGPAGGTPPTPPGPAPTGPPAPTYSEGDESSLGILRSTDRGATWTSLGDDGLSFAAESGVRILNPDGYRGVGDPEPIRLRDGSYLMYYQAIVPDPEEGREWVQELHLATSQDGFDWTPDPTVIGHGGTSCVVEAPDGTLFIYYGN